MSEDQVALLSEDIARHVAEKAEAMRRVRQLESELLAAHEQEDGEVHEHRRHGGVGTSPIGGGGGGGGAPLSPPASARRRRGLRMCLACGVDGPQQQQAPDRGDMSPGRTQRAEQEVPLSQAELRRREARPRLEEATTQVIQEQVCWLL